MGSSRSRSKEGRKRTKIKPRDPIYGLNPSNKGEVQTEGRSVRGSEEMHATWNVGILNI